MKIILVCGGRFFSAQWAVEKALDDLTPEAVMQGGCPSGADWLAKNYARERGLPGIEVEANWDYYGRSAGPRRNAWMALLKPTVVLAMPGGTGTANSVQRSQNNLQPPSTQKRPHTECTHASALRRFGACIQPMTIHTGRLTPAV